MKQPPRPRRSRFSSAPEASSTPEVSSESSQGFVAPEEAPGEGSSSDTVASSPEASVSDRPAPSLAQASSVEEKKEAERAARRKRNRELRRARREASAQSPSSGELLNRPLGNRMRLRFWGLAMKAQRLI